MDLDQGTWVWRKSFDSSDGKMQLITSLAVNPQETQVVAYASELNFGFYDERSFIWVVSASDGHYLTDVLKIDFGDEGYGEFIADSSGMFFDQYGKVYIAL